MQDNTITLNVNHDNDDGTTSTVPVVYSRFEEYLNRSTYISGDHSLDSSDTLKLFRTLPKPSGNFRGVAKTAVKFTKDFAVEGVDSSTSLKAPVIIEVAFNMPVGVTAAEMLEMRQTAVALLNNDAVMYDLNHIQMV